MMKTAEQLGVPIPTSHVLVTRNSHYVSAEERFKILKAAEFNGFIFPSSLLVCDFLSDSGCSAMSDVQWAALLRGDEAYGRNHGYFALQDSVRQTFEHGDGAEYLVHKIIVDSWLPTEQSLNDVPHGQGGFVNAGRFQLERPNFFITPQGRCAEFLLYSTLSNILLADQPKDAMHSRYIVPSNGFFDTTEAHVHVAGFVPINLFAPNFHDEFPVAEIGRSNPFKGDIDIAGLERTVAQYGADRIPFVLLTITNNTAAGQPVSMRNIKQTSEICRRNRIPLCFDAARFAENAYFIKRFEAGYADRSIPSIVKEMFEHCDVFTMSAKKDGLANIGGFLAFRDRGLFWEKYSRPGRDVGVVIKEKQILCYGNDSYGGLSGRDIMALAMGLSQVVSFSYLDRRARQSQSLAERLARNNVPLILPPGAHALYLDMDKFFEGTPMKIDDFGGVGLVIEMIRLYAVRLCELGPFAFEWDQKTAEQRKGILNLVRIAIPRNLYTEDHMAYTAAAIIELHHNRQLIPKVVVTRGAELHLRHFQSGLRPIYPPEHPLHSASL